MTETSTGWQRLIDLSYGQRFRYGLTYILPTILFGGFLGRLIIDVFAADAPQWLQVMLYLSGVVIVLAATALIVAAVQGALYVNLSERLLRVRRRVVRFEEVNVAAIEGMGARNPSNAYTLRFGVDKGVQVRVPLQRGPRGMSEESRERLLTVLRASTIGMPSDSYDPTGKFSRYNFPENVTKEQVLDIVENHPEPHEPQKVY